MSVVLRKSYVQYGRPVVFLSSFDQAERMCYVTEFYGLALLIDNLDLGNVTSRTSSEIWQN